MKMSKFYFISVLMIFISSLIFMNFYYFLLKNMVVLIEFQLLCINSILYSYIFYIDWMCLVFMFIVITISSLIMVYSSGYIQVECHKFMWLTVLFILFMLIMIMSPSIIGVLLGWDGLGIISYCLVIYYQSSDAFNSGFITAATNRLGDAMLILSVVWVSMNGMFMAWEIPQEIGFFLVACLTKSAQFPFSAWLPAAMAAPTPISSLVHSSTLVTAGVYMMIRFYNSYAGTSLMIFLLLLSSFTIFIAGIMSLKEMDMKRLIALSTLGQLGFMMLVLSIGYVYVSFFHLLIHALFKALLFMSAGFIIHSSLGIQDLRKMGSINSTLIIKVALIVSSASLMGMPFTAGFYSKDSILELVLCSNGGLGLGIFILSMAMITVSYSLRMITYLSSCKGWFIWMSSNWSLGVPVYLLCSLNIILGFFLNLFISDLYFICMSLVSKLLPLLMVFFGLLWGGISWFKFNYLYFFLNLFYLSSLTKTLMVIMFYFFKMYKLMDQGWLEGSMKNLKLNMIMSSSWMKNYLTDFFYFSCLGLMILFLVLV
uniref:NADH:ubiquinone reductase (H(+)-translocating) n=1 Tax=Calophya schini TaxID=121824 RepID=A0A343LDQ5_9HEMI|nr:NADH dehydrogenase subunit 5 [Calophya schini]